MEATLRSLHDQTNKNIEVIIIDDGSSDDSLLVATQLLDKFSLPGHVVKRPDTEPKGVASCRNIGVRKASYDWVSFLDSDDLFVATTVQKTLENIEKYGQVNYAFFHGVREFDDETNETLLIRIHEFENKPTNIFEQLIQRNFITTSAVSLKKSLIEEIGYFDIKLHGVEDYMMWLRVSKRTTWVYSKDVLTEYRVRKTSLMGGRHFLYYLEQNSKLVASIKDTQEFTESNIIDIVAQLDKTINYYAMISIDVYGWGDFFSGISYLYKNGKASLATKLLKIHVTNYVIKKIGILIKRK